MNHNRIYNQLSEIWTHNVNTQMITRFDDIRNVFFVCLQFPGAFIYVFFGTIKEVSIGPTSLMAIVSIGYYYRSCVFFLHLFIRS